MGDLLLRRSNATGGKGTEGSFGEDRGVAPVMTTFGRSSPARDRLELFWPIRCQIYGLDKRRQSKSTKIESPMLQRSCLPVLNNDK